MGGQLNFAQEVHEGGFITSDAEIDRVELAALRDLVERLAAANGVDAELKAAMKRQVDTTSERLS
ncbi:hypothetical protein [Roseateles violae]|uniref:Uncharacterized protein n=1 Tax=Roseateles violae TaxID=3058042 RepID=A0ABT8DW71_9BURK|nr:hypothetical protein [Pelomonas sp. PFR6]MDN3922512.1 hypothetical protein [Pelomonas sp. PFR6]